MSIPDFQTLMLPVLVLVSKGPTKVSEAVEQLSNDFSLSEEDRNQLLPSGKQTTIANRVAWAFSYLSKSGLIIRIARATYEISNSGKATLQGRPKRIDIKFLSQFDQFLEFRTPNSLVGQTGAAKGDVGELATTGTTPEEQVENGARELNTALQSELIERLRSMSPTAFERVIIDLMDAMGYGANGAKTHVGKSGDGGIDGIITEDALGLDVIYLQAKRYAEGNNIGVEKIREFVGTLDERGATKGVFVTTSRFAAGALQYSSRSTKRIKLIDGDELTRLMIHHNVAVRTTQSIHLKKVNFDYFEDLET